MVRQRDAVAGDVFAIEQPDGFGALQVTADTPTGVVVCLRDWFGPQLPTVADLADVAPLWLTHHAHFEHRYGYGGEHVSRPLTDHRLIKIGNAPVEPSRPTSIVGYTGWEYFPHQLTRQRHWDQFVPVAAQAAYQAETSDAPDRLDFGAGDGDVASGMSGIDFTNGNFPLPAAGPVRWEALDSMPVTEIRWTGADRGVVDAVGARPLIDELFWTDPPTEVDLSATALADVWFSPGLRSLRLPDGLITCTFMPGAEPASVTAQDDGYWIYLQLNGPAPRVPAGLHRVRALRIDGPGDMSLAGLAGADELVTLSVYLSSGPGRIDKVPPLAGLKNLTFSGAYGLTAEMLPDLPALRELTIDGIPRSAVAGFRERYRGTDVRLTVRGAKSDVWLRANLDNPFRDWVEDNERAGKTACKAYATALRDIDRTPADAETILLTFVEALNRLDERYDVIDTMRREDAADAFAELAARASLPAGTGVAWFDQWRDF